MTDTLEAGPATREAIERLRQAKKAEEQAKAMRIAAETALLNKLAFAKDEGAQTYNFGDVKVTCTAKVTRKLDADKWDAVAHHIPEEFRPVRYKPELILKGLRYIQEHKPAYYKILAGALDVKPAKPAIKLEVGP